MDEKRLCAISKSNIWVSFLPRSAESRRYQHLLLRDRHAAAVVGMAARRVVGTNVRKVRKALRWTQVELGKRIAAQAPRRPRRLVDRSATDLGYVFGDG